MSLRSKLSSPSRRLGRRGGPGLGRAATIKADRTWPERALARRQRECPHPREYRLVTNVIGGPRRDWCALCGATFRTLHWQDRWSQEWTG